MKCPTPEIQEFWDAKDLWGCVKRLRQFSYFSLPSRNLKKIEILARLEQKKISESAESKSHEKKTDDLILIYRETKDEAEKNRILNLIYERRDEWYRIFGRYNEILFDFCKSEEAKEFCRKYRHHFR